MGSMVTCVISCLGIFWILAKGRISRGGRENLTAFQWHEV